MSKFTKTATFTGSVVILNQQDRDARRVAQLPSGDYVTTERVVMFEGEEPKGITTLKIIAKNAVPFKVGQRVDLTAEAGTESYVGKLFANRKAVAGADGQPIMVPKTRTILRVDTTEGLVSVLPKHGTKLEDLLNASAAAGSGSDAAPRK